MRIKFLKEKILKHKKIMIIGVAVLLIGLISFPLLIKPQSTDEAVREREYVAKKDNITVGVESSGIINALPNLHSFVENTVIDDIFVKVGSEVKKGDKLAKISLDNLKELIQLSKDELSDARAALLETQSTKDVLISQNNETNKSSISQLEKDFSIKFDSLNSEKQNLQKNIEDSKGYITSLENEISTLLPKVKEIENKISNLKAQINENIIKIGDLNEQLLSQNNISEVSFNLKEGDSTEANSIRLQILQLQNKNTALQQEIDKLLENSNFSTLNNLKIEKSKEDTNLENYFESLSLKIEEIQKIEKEYNQSLEAQIDNNTFSNYKTNKEVIKIDENITKVNRAITYAQEKLSKLESLEKNPILYAEMDGVVTSLNYKLGESTVKEKPFCVIGEINKIKMTIPVSASDIGSISVGQKVNIYVEAYAEQQFTGKVEEKLLLANDNGDFDVTISVDPSENLLLPGMKAFATIILKEKDDILTISNKAIFIEDGTQFVNIRKENGELIKNKIITGFSDGRISEVLDGLSENDVTVVKE